MSHIVGERARDFFYVHLFSNSSNKNDTNTTINFTNTLAKSLLLPHREKWHVALHQIVCNNKFNVRASGEEGTFQFMPDENDDYNLSQIYVRCEQIEQAHDGRQLLSCHSRTPYNETENRVHYWAPSNLLYFPLNSEIITDISISLHKSNLDLLVLREGQPTSVSLKFKRMSEHLVPIYISSKGKGSQDGNTASKFSVEIPPYYNNHGSYIWQIALASFTYIPDFKVFPTRYRGGSFFSVREWELEHDANDLVSFVQESDDERKHHLYLSEETIDSWTRESDIRKYLYTLMIHLKFPDGKDMTSGVTFGNIFDEGKREEDYEGTVNITFTRPCVFHMPEWLANIIGFRGYVTTNNGCTAEFISRSPKVFHARAKMDAYRLVPHSMSVHAEFIQPFCVGSVQSKILRTIPIQHKFSRRQPSLTFEPKNLEYHDIATRELNMFNLELLDMAGNQVEFANDKQNVILGLVLKMIG